jgi:hypothetical protein
VIAALSRAVAARLAEKKFPHPVHYGPERAERKGFDMGVVFYRDRQAGDPITPPKSANAAPPGVESPYNRQVSGAVEVYARSPKPGATAEDHEDECDRVCDGVLCALYAVLAGRRLPLQIVESRLLTAADFNDAEQWPGTAARIRFRVTTLVRDVDYTGAGLGTYVVETVETEVNPMLPYEEP